MMKTLKVDMRWLTDEFYYYEFTGETDDYNAEIYKEPQLVKNCKIELISQFNRKKMKTDDDTQAVIFCYASATTPFKLFKKRSKVSIFGEEYEIKRVLPFKEPSGTELWSIEIEVRLIGKQV